MSVDINIKNNKEFIEIRPEGEATILTAKEIYNKILPVVDLKKEIQINNEKVTTADITYLQILFSLEKHFQAKKVKYKIDYNSNVIADLLIEVGADFYDTNLNED